MTVITPSIKAYVDGLLLGDGSIEMGVDGKKARYSQRCIHKEWLRKIAEFFKVNMNIQSSIFPTKMVVHGKEYYAYDLKTEFSTIFKWFKDRWYQEDSSGRRIKQVPSDIEFTEHTLANWFMGDGYLERKERIVRVIFSTQGFNDESRRVLARILKEKFDLEATIQTSTGKIAISATDYPKFVHIVEPLILPCFRYKLFGRPSWDEYFMEHAKVTAKRSTCLRRQVGCILVRGKRIIAHGYNGAVSGEEHCIDRGYCSRPESEPGHGYEDCVGVHAEENALLECAKLGHSTKGATAYVTAKPCNICLKHMKQAGISKVIYLDEDGNMQTITIG